MSKTIKIAEEVFDLTPNEFKNLPDVEYKLTKIESSREGFVSIGDYDTGFLKVVEVVGLPAACVSGRGFQYLRTSPIVEVLDSTEDTVTFRTEGGVYRLEKR